MSQFVISPAPQASVAVAGSDARFPVRRVFCVGRNYAAHAREMGSNPDREPPFFFMKPADAVVAAEGTLPYPPLTSELHHEIELVVAIGADGENVDAASALSLAAICNSRRKTRAVRGTGARRSMHRPPAARCMPWRKSVIRKTAACGST
jgi:hypothetical protein